MDFCINIFGNIIIRSHDIHQRQRISVLICIDGIVERHILSAFLVVSKIHQDLVFDTARGITGKLDVFIRIKGVDRFDQPDSADRDQIVLIGACLIILFDDMRNQTQIVFNKDIPRVDISF